MTAEAEGNVRGKKITLQRTLYVPNLKKNLISVNAVTNNGGTVVFTNDKVTISKDSEEILKGKKEAIKKKN